MEPSPEQYLCGYMAESLQAMQDFVTSTSVSTTIIAMAQKTAAAMRDGRKLLIAGNGGSAGDAQHIAGEFVSRLMFDRAPLSAVALTTDSSILTAVGNDYGYELVFDRQVRALGNKGDIFLAISTSGKSPNVLRALDTAAERGLYRIGFCGASGAPMRERTELLLEISSSRTSVIQQLHIVAAHAFCALVEREMFG